MDLSTGHWLYSIVVSSFFNHLNLTGRYAAAVTPPVLLLWCCRIYLHCVKAPHNPSYTSTLSHPSRNASICRITFQRAKLVIIDPGLYMTKKADVFWITQRRSVPTAFKLFTGSAWMALSRSFIDYCIWGWDNLPRTVLMYYANFISSPEGYFHTVVCNAQEFRNTTVNSDLHFISWDNPPKQHPHYLTLVDMQRMVDSNAPFARKFPRDDPMLDKIDAELLFRNKDMLVPGGWCIGSRLMND